MKKGGALFLFFLLLLIAPKDCGANEKPKCPGNKRALVLSGGGISGAYQAGVLWYLVRELGCDFSYFVGTSTGAVTAALLAQAGTWTDLKEQVELLVNDYKSIRSTSQVVRAKPLAMLRAVLLPAWLAPNGLYNLEPIAERLRQRVDPRRVKNLLVPALSLQSGRLILSSRHFHEIEKQPHPLNPELWGVLLDDSFMYDFGQITPDSFIDFIIGSASIPLAVEPREVHIWANVILDRLDQNILMVRSAKPIGIPDPNCKLMFEGSVVIPCEHIETRWVDLTQEWKTTLRLLALSDPDRKKLLELINKRNEKGLVTGLHQVVDGGVTDYFPIEAILPAMVANKEIDTVFILNTHPRWIVDTPHPSNGAIEIGLSTYDRLWESYYKKALGLFEQAQLMKFLVELGKTVEWIEGALKWRESLRRRLGSDELERIERTMPEKFPSEKAEFIKEMSTVPEFVRKLVELVPNLESVKVFPFAPWEEFFSGPLDIREDAITGALYHGCAQAMSLFWKSSLPEPMPGASGKEQVEFAGKRQDEWEASAQMACGLLKGKEDESERP